MSTQEQRERFAAWHRERYGWYSESTMDQDLITDRFEAWQFVEAAAIERCAEISDMVRSKFSSSGHIQQAAGAWCVQEELRNRLPKEK